MKERLTVTQVRCEAEVTAFGDAQRRYAAVSVVAEGVTIRRLEWWVGVGTPPQVGDEVEVEVSVRAVAPA